MTGCGALARKGAPASRGFNEKVRASQRRRRVCFRKRERRAHRSGHQEKFPGRRHACALRDGIEGVAFDFAADLPIDHRRSKNCRTTLRRQKHDPLAGARVERVGFADQPRDERTKPFVEVGFGEPCVRVDAGFPQPLSGQIDSPETRILADVAGDVGELHRDPEIAGAGERLRRSHAHHQRHHHADCACDARRVVEKVLDRFVASAFGVPGKPFEQRLGNGGGNGAPAHEIGHGAIGRIWLRAPPFAAQPRRSRNRSSASFEPPLRSIASSDRRQKA